MYGRTDGRSRDYYVTTKISRIDRLPYFLSNGAPLAGFARRLRYYGGKDYDLVNGL